MAETLKAACIQLNCGPNIDENLVRVEELIRAAAAQGASFIATPENTCHIRFPPEQKRSSAHAENTHPAIPKFSNLAKELRVTLLVGSLSIKADDDKIFNRSYVFNAQGHTQAIYNKIHLFDITLPSETIHAESNLVTPGDQAVSVKLDDAFTLGLSICYDIRFAYLYRDLAQKGGANILCAPAAFTVPTGKAHWETLLRARAIETGSYMIAPAQVGEHEGGRKTYGHSMIINPWGKVIAELEEGEGIITAEINKSDIDKVRGMIPCLTHDREYESITK